MSNSLDLTIEPDGEGGGHCDCCGNQTRRIWGYASQGEATYAAYFVTWTIGRPEDLARVDLVMGRWGEGATPDDRCRAHIDYSIPDGGSFCVRDADSQLASLATCALKRTEIISTPLAQGCFDILDAIWLSDPRIDALMAEA